MHCKANNLERKSEAAHVLATVVPHDLDINV